MQITILDHRVQVASSEASGLLAKVEELQALAACVTEFLTTLDAVHRNYADVERLFSAIRQTADAASSVLCESFGFIPSRSLHPACLRYRTAAMLAES